MSKKLPFNSFLSEDGLIIFEELQNHCRSKLKMMDADVFELSMLVNSFALYAECAAYCNLYGVSMSFGKMKKAEKEAEREESDEEDDDDDDNGGQAVAGIYQQVRPEYTVMKNEYQNILKHSAKFGLNPGDREKIFKGLEKKKKKSITEGI